MILYLDSSALVKRYVSEAGVAEIKQAISRATVVGTAIIARAEVAAALAKAVRMQVLGQEDAGAALQALREDWSQMVRVQVSEAVAARAESLAWEHGLRGFDAVHLAAALAWQEGLGQPVTLATFDRRLWLAAGRVGLVAYPGGLGEQGAIHE